MKKIMEPGRRKMEPSGIRVRQRREARSRVKLTVTTKKPDIVTQIFGAQFSLLKLTLLELLANMLNLFGYTKNLHC